MSDPILIPILIQDQDIRAIVERAKAMGLLPSVVMESLTTQTAAPAVDEATVQAICKIIGHPYHKQWEAERLIRSIQRGEVPGLPSPDEHAELIRQRQHIFSKWQEAAAERDAAIARAESAERERDEWLAQWRSTFDACSNRTSERDAYRAAHAEAMELLRKMDAMLPYVARDPNVLKHLAKYGKDASK